VVTTDEAGNQVIGAVVSDGQMVDASGAAITVEIINNFEPPTTQ